MFQIRRGVFETNSSSSHSISIRKNGHTYSKEEIMNGLWIDPDDGSYSLWESELEFGRSPFEPLTTFKDKIRFALASYADNLDKVHEICDIFAKYTEGSWLDLRDAEVDNDDEDEVRWYGKDNIKGSIDHQSIGLLQNFLRRHRVSLEEFLTNSKYVVWIDGDEYCIKEKLFKSGLIHAEDFEEIDASNSEKELKYYQSLAVQEDDEDDDSDEGWDPQLLMMR